MVASAQACEEGIHVACSAEEGSDLVQRSTEILRRRSATRGNQTRCEEMPSAV